MTIRQAVAVLALAFPASVWAQAAYPSKPVRVIVPFAPGTGPESTVRLFNEKFLASTGQPLVVDAKGGAGGNIGTDAVAKAAPDGYTIGLVGINMLVINPHLYKDLPFDPIKSFEPITQLVNSNHVLAVNGNVPASNLGEFIAWAKANAGKVSISTNGAGTTPHLLAVLLNQNTGLDLLPVHYKGGGEAIKDLVGGHIQAMFGSPFQMMPFTPSGRVRILATTKAKRADAIPDVPTFLELGYPDLVADAWTAYIAPAGTPAAIVQKLYGEFARILALPEVTKALENEGYTPVGSTPAETAQMIRSELKRWETVVKASGWKVQ